MALWFIFSHFFGPKKEKIFLPCKLFPQKYVQCHLWFCAISVEWRLIHFMNLSRYNLIAVFEKSVRNTAFGQYLSNNTKFLKELKKSWIFQMVWQMTIYGFLNKRNISSFNFNISSIDIYINKWTFGLTLYWSSIGTA